MKHYFTRPRAGPYNPRVFIKAEEGDGAMGSELKKICLWGGHDKEWVDSNGDLWYGYEFLDDKFDLATILLVQNKFCRIVDLP